MPTNIPNLPSLFKDQPGVMMSPPPSEFMSDTTDLIQAAADRLADGEKGRFVWVATTEGVNVAVVEKINDRVSVTAWFGKEWGGPIAAGLMGKISW